jgi:hypothetical protein
VSERVAEINAAVEKSAARLGELERQLMRARENLGLEGRRQIERLRSELRAARREFRLARNRWRRAIEELYALPVPALVTA